MANQIPFIVNDATQHHKNQILNFLGEFDHAVFFDSNTHANVPIPVTGVNFDFIAAAGCVDVFQDDKFSPDALQLFFDHHSSQKNWIFGYMTYDVKNEIEKLQSVNPDHIGFPELHFFVPQHLFVAKSGSIHVFSNDSEPESLWNKVMDAIDKKDEKSEIRFSHMLNREDYLTSVKHILQHIQQGDIYELNFCHEVKLNFKKANAIQLYKRLNAVSPNPFSAYYKTNGCHLMCASPERFLMRKGDQLYSQPMKGTAARNEDINADAAQKAALASDEKEQSENVMIVDLARNDLSKIATKGSVKVNELFGVYTFPGAHQMISTVSGTVKELVKFTDIIRAAFPMGSMTGAPKVSAMKLIDRYENFRRGLFSGTVGYIHPCGDFDFNVVIRSILYNEQTGNMSVPAGGAITAASDPEKEYDETMVKLKPQLKALGASLNHPKSSGTADQYA